MKVGGSPLYYLEENVEMLENFYNYLGTREKDAFLMLKEKLVLQDSELHPAIRVALRSIKDFAYPLVIKINESETLFWRYFKINENEAKEKIKEYLQQRKFSFSSPTPKKESPIGKEEVNENEGKEIEVKTEEPKEKPLIKIKEKKEKIKEDSSFIKNLREKFHNSNIEIIEEKETSKKDFEAIVRIDSGIGKIMFYCVSKDKKSISDTDLAVCLQKAQGNRLPLFFLCDGKLSKKAEVYMQEWKTLIKVKRIKELT
jgi:hypothetical protein